MAHPQTDQVLPVAFRLAAFVPVNIPICAGMLLTQPTLINTVFWQWANQSYNAGFNYANRNASSESETSAILSTLCQYPTSLFTYYRNYCSGICISHSSLVFHCRRSWQSRRKSLKSKSDAKKFDSTGRERQNCDRIEK